MTSSFDNFGNVVGTPRDKLPDISDTNYLRTEADLTEAVNKEIDNQIVDTKEFYAVSYTHLTLPTIFRV